MNYIRRKQADFFCWMVSAWQVVVFMSDFQLMHWTEILKSEIRKMLVTKPTSEPPIFWLELTIEVESEFFKENCQLYWPIFFRKIPTMITIFVFATYRPREVEMQIWSTEILSKLMVWNAEFHYYDQYVFFQAFYLTIIFLDYFFLGYSIEWFLNSIGFPLFEILSIASYALLFSELKKLT